MAAGIAVVAIAAGVVEPTHILGWSWEISIRQGWALKTEINEIFLQML